MHYARLRIHGEVGEAAQRCATNGQGRHVGALGYMVVQAGADHPLADSTGRVYEHRFVAWNAGLLTDPALVVHHINGDKQDNRLENLEVLSRSSHIKEHQAELRLARWGTAS